MTSPTLCLLAAVFVAAIHVQASSSHVVEVYFGVEPQVLRNYVTKFGYDEATAKTNLLGDMDFMVYQVNEYLKSLSAQSINVEVRVKQMEILTDEMFEDCHLIGNKLYADFGLASAQEWLKNNKAHAGIGYDMAVLWTGYELYDGDRRLSVGVSSRGKVCAKEDAAALVEFDGTQKTAVITAREIAHSLGASLDLQNSCNPYDGYITAPFYQAHEENRWSFSSCSISDLKASLDALDQSQNNCLKDTTASAQVFDPASQSERDILNVQQMCKRGTMFKESHFCKTVPGMDEGDLKCQNIACSVPNGGNTCYFYTPTEGLVCGDGKRCDKGKCVASSIPAPVVPESNNCFDGLGEITMTKSGVSTKGTCEEMINNPEHGPSICYHDSIEKYCCSSCSAVKSADPDCLYGDRWSVCNNNYCASQYASYCCKTCKDSENN